MSSPRLLLAAVGAAGMLVALGPAVAADGAVTDATGPDDLAAQVDDVPPEYLEDPDATGFRVDIEGRVLDLSGTVERLAGDDLLYGVEEEEIHLGADVFFEFDEAELTDAAGEALDELAEDIRERADAAGALQVVGHTDDIGEADYNQNLSEDRAQAVAEYLTDEFDLDDVDLTAEGRGQDEPIAPNETDDGDDNEEGRAQNRRVELTFES